MIYPRVRRDKDFAPEPRDTSRPICKVLQHNLFKNVFKGPAFCDMRKFKRFNMINK